MSTYSESTAVPRIVITPTPEDNEKRRASWTTFENSSDKTTNHSEDFAILASQLNQLYSHNLERITASQERTVQINDEQKMQNASPISLSLHVNGNILSQSQELDSSQSESDSESESASESETESESESSDSSPAKPTDEAPHFYEPTRNDSLYEIEDIGDSEIHSDDESADIIEFIIENGDRMSNCDTLEFNDHLSVIFEEDEHSHGRRLKLDSMCSSNSSATLANDDKESYNFHSEDENDDNNDDHDYDEDKDEDESNTVESDNNDESDSDDESVDNEDDQSTSVTVRLPLRLSFSRSSNDEEITTVMVGKSEIKIEENIPSSKTPALTDSSPDVSVSISLRPRSRPTFSEQSSVETSNYKSLDNDDDDSEMSVSVSLPLRHRTLSPAPLKYRPTFTRQHTLSPVPHSRDEFEYKVWNRGFSIERDTAIPKPIEIRNSNDHQLEENDDELDEKMSMRERIAAFESISTNKKEELRRQNACTSFDEPIQEENVEFSDQMHSNLPQTEEIDSHTAPTNYESFVTNQYTINLLPESTEYIESQQSFDESNDENNEQPEQDFRANLSVQQKIAAFEQPTLNQPTKIDARQEICMAREINNNPENNEQIECKSYLKSVDHIQPQNNNYEVSFTQESPSNGHAKLSRSIHNQRSTIDESEIEETDSGVDIHRRISEDIDTESECYSELRKLTRYERAATHSRLFKILQEYESDMSDIEKSKCDEEIVPLSRPKKLVHNVSITRKQNPELVKQAETMAERRERLHLNYNSSSIDADNPSSSASPSCTSPTPSVNEKLIDELVHSVLQQTKRRNLRNIPIEKIQAAARRALIQQHEENDSCDTFSSFDSTPALTPHEFHDDYYDSDPDRHMDILPSKAFKNLQEQSTYGRKNKLWAARCPRVLSSKTVNSDLSRVTESRESQTPERDQQYAYPH